MKPYALVLGGGGARGVYQIGAMKVLHKMGFKFNAVIGTSVGALNGALLAQDDFQKCMDAWDSIKLKDVVDLPDELLVNGQLRISAQNLKFLQTYQRFVIKNGGLDTSPLRKTMQKLVDEKKIRRSGLDFGMVTYELKSFKPLEVFIDKIPQGQMIDYLMATSALPGFKATEINGRTFVDGGIFDNVPFNTAKNRGYKRIIVIDVSAIGIVRKAEIDGTETIYLKNSVDLSNMLDFTTEAKRRGMLIGELDALKLFNQVSGIKYFYDMDKAVAAKLTSILLHQNIVDSCRKLVSKKKKHKDDDNPEMMLRNILPEDMRIYPQLSIPFMECAAMMLGVEVVKRYKMEELLLEIRRRFKQEDNNDIPINVQGILSQLKQINILDFVNTSRKALPPGLLFRLEDHLPVGSISTLIPQFIPARLFHLVLEEYFKN